MRRNPVRQAELAATRTATEPALARRVAAATNLREPPRARPATAQRRLEKRRRSLGLHHWLNLASHGREFSRHPAATALAEERQLDGC